MLHARKDYNERVQDSANLIPDDEPVFLLRAQDVLAPEMLKYYAQRLAQYSGHSRMLVEAVQEHEERMRKWQREVSKKLPDMPEDSGLDRDGPEKSDPDEDETGDNAKDELEGMAARPEISDDSGEVPGAESAPSMEDNKN